MTKILFGYLNQSYTVEPITVYCDISFDAIGLVFNMLGLNIFDLEHDIVIYTKQTEIEFYRCFPPDIYRLKFKLDTELPESDQWYIVDQQSKRIIYSPGA